MRRCRDAAPSDVAVQRWKQRLGRRSEAEEGWMDEHVLTQRASRGDRDAMDQLVEIAADSGDRERLRQLAELGSSDAVDELVQLAGELGDLAELRRLADEGSSDARDVLEELTDDAG
jgi:hypothetical protein